MPCPSKKAVWECILNVAGLTGAFLFVLAFLPPILEPNSAHEKHTSAADWLRFSGMAALTLSNLIQTVIQPVAFSKAGRIVGTTVNAVTPFAVGGSMLAAGLLTPSRGPLWMIVFSRGTPATFLLMGIYKSVLMAKKTPHNSKWNMGTLLLVLVGIGGIGVCSVVGDEKQLASLLDLNIKKDIYVKLVMAFISVGFLALKPGVKIIETCKDPKSPEQQQAGEASTNRRCCLCSAIKDDDTSTSEEEADPEQKLSEHLLSPV